MKTRRKYGANSKDFNSQIAPAANLPVSPNLHPWRCELGQTGSVHENGGVCDGFYLSNPTVKVGL